MITYRNKLNFVTIQWLWFLCLILAALNSSNTWTHYAEATQPQQQQQQQHQQQQLKSTLQLQQEVKSNGPQQQDVTVRNFSPRIDYNNNEWRPVGRGDPLKNDPTFDYSPPTLDRVRYWADSEKDKEKPEEVSAALIDAKLKKANPGKNEILLLGVTGDRMRGSGGALQQHSAPNIGKNAKGETPLLQPKYTSIRRSYYAHQLPTHLMPPPMQPMIPATQQNQLQSSQMQVQQSQQQQSHAMHIVKPVHTEYRHNMPGHSYMTSSSPMGPMSAAHSKHYHISTATQPWTHTSTSPSSSGHSLLKMPGNSHHYSYPHSHAIDAHHQETVNYLSYHNRPSLTSTPSIMLGVNGGMGHHEFYSPNSIRGSSSGSNLSPTSSRKPWIHDLLQKEFIKRPKPTHNPNSYSVEHIKPVQIEPMAWPKGISTTYAPVTFVTPTLPSTTTSTNPPIYITSTTQKQATTSTSQSPMYSSTSPTPPTHTTNVPRTTTTLSPTRLLIPNTSNLAFRPTVSPLKMTTDSLFSHYNQPEKPIRGPMYLIIEGHSKVKTYGKDELDPHKPKIVPIIPKREPVVRMADPNETKRGTPETFQVKHLHTTTSTTTTKKPTKQMKTTPKTTTTVKPKTSTTAKQTPKKLEITTAATTKSPTTTVKPTTTNSTPKLSVTTKAAKPKLEKTSHKDIKGTGKSDKPMAITDLKMSAKIPNPNALDTLEKPSHQTAVNEPPTAMQGLLSFLDSSLDRIFKEENPIADNAAVKMENDMELRDSTTIKLKPIPQQQQQVEARVSTKLQPIKAQDYDDYVNDNYFTITTEYLPRETRQVFDYDQLPETRINLKDNTNFDDFLKQLDNADDLSAFNLDDEYEDEDELEAEAIVNSDTNKHDLTKRIHKPVGGSSTKDDDDDDDDFDDLSSLVDDDLTDTAEDLTDLARNQQRQNEDKKA